MLHSMGRKELDMTERLNRTELNGIDFSPHPLQPTTLAIFVLFTLSCSSTIWILRLSVSSGVRCSNSRELHDSLKCLLFRENFSDSHV